MSKFSKGLNRWDAIYVRTPFPNTEIFDKWNIFFPNREKNENIFTQTQQARKTTQICAHTATKANSQRI